MAFEERCSPQSAPSPPGVPHSPHNTTMICVDMNSNSSFSTSHEMALDVCSDRVSPVVMIKQEEDNNNMSNQPEAPISFSITNILSNSFGKISRKTSTDRRSSLFRPYDTNASANEQSPSSSPHKTTIDEIHLENVQRGSAGVPPKYNDIVDYSHRVGAFVHNNNVEHAKFMQFYHHHQNQLQLAAVSSLYNSRLHEDILNTKKYHQYYQPAPLLSENALSKIPPLGNLCKTVSQIGQPSATPTIPTKTPTAIPPPKKVNHVAVESTERLDAPATQQKKQQPKTQPQTNSLDSGLDSSDDAKSESGSTKDENGSALWPAWIYCTRYSDRPSSGPRYRKPKQPRDKTNASPEEKRPRTAFSLDQLNLLKREFNENRYLTERRRQQLSSELGLNEAQIKIWFQNKRAKIKKSSGSRNPLALQLAAQGLYNHSTVPLTKEEEELEMRMNGQL